jgi:hypothetical protein
MKSDMDIIGHLLLSVERTGEHQLPPGVSREQLAYPLRL